MILAIDIGNSSIKFGIFDGEQLFSKFSIPITCESSPADLKIAIGPNLDQPISNAFVCSVVPEIQDSISEYFRAEFDVKPVFVTNDFDFGLTINYEPLSDAGTDRLVNSYAAVEKYGVPSVVCSFGTALTIDAVDKHRVFLGGLIAPGMKTIAKALNLNTSKLPEVPIEMPATAIQNTTIGSLQSGIVFGYFGLVKELISKVKHEIGDNPKVVATGGFASMIAEKTDAIDIVDENLLLDGLRLLAKTRSAK